MFAFSCDALTAPSWRAGRRISNLTSWVQAGWGDDAQDPLDTPLNPHFNREGLEEYSKSTLRNLARLDEDRIDFDLLEELVTYIDQEYGDGAILVFLPGMPLPPRDPLTALK